MFDVCFVKLSTNIDMIMYYQGMFKVWYVVILFGQHSDWGAEYEYRAVFYFRIFCRITFGHFVLFLAFATFSSSQNLNWFAFALTRAELGVSSQFPLAGGGGVNIAPRLTSEARSRARSARRLSKVLNKEILIQFYFSARSNVGSSQVKGRSWLFRPYRLPRPCRG